MTFSNDVGKFTEAETKVSKPKQRETEREKEKITENNIIFSTE